MIYDTFLIDNHEAPSRLAIHKFSLALRQAQTQLCSDLIAVGTPMSEADFKDLYTTSINEALGVTAFPDKDQPFNITRALPMWLERD